jgi:hypothetical protein
MKELDRTKMDLLLLLDGGFEVDMCSADVSQEARSARETERRSQTNRKGVEER